MLCFGVRRNSPVWRRRAESTAAVLLTDDALAGRSAAAHLFVDDDLLPV
jgi:hypothetical protein